ncbi:MAG: M48 family metallopeptidase [Candidatus Hadarchaeum sp.]|nr:M48 family metallopeptidase [Candidatus Hadarchaeum sp.]
MQKISFLDQIAKNKRNSIFLIIFVVALVAAIVYVIIRLFFPQFALIFLAFALVIVISHASISYRYGDQIVLKATGARPADPVQHAYLINTVEGLSIAAGIPPPKVYVVDNKEINAFACGKDPKHASIAVTTGALENLNRTELEGVVGHEMSHIANYDIRLMTLIAVLVGLVAILSYMLLRSYRFAGRDERGKGAGLLIVVGFLLAIFAPIVSRLVQAMISRKREYAADAGGAQLTRYPEGLASALEKIKNINQGNMKVSESISHLFISDPSHTPLDEIFATHPPLTERIKILRAM